MLPDFRIRQRDYLLEITRAITQELDLQKVLKRILRISIEMLAGQAGLPGSIDGTGVGARFNFPHGVAVDGLGNVYVADTFNSTIRQVTPGGVVTTLAGQAGSTGSADGAGTAAGFNSPSGVAVDGSGNLYVADSNNDTIRLGRPTLADVATIDSATGAVGQARQLDTAPQTATGWLWQVTAAPRVRPPPSLPPRSAIRRSRPTSRALTSSN